MPRVIRDTLVSVRELLITAGRSSLLTVALLAGAYYLLKPTPPKRVVLATGSEQGAYAAFGKRYQEELKRFGIEVVLRPSAGSRENLRLLQDPKQDVQIAFVQGGASETQRAAEDEDEEEKLPVMSLGSMFYEPVWLFYRADAAKKLKRDGVLTRILAVARPARERRRARQRHSRHRQPHAARQPHGPRRHQAQQPRPHARGGRAARAASSTRWRWYRRRSRRWCRCCCRRPASACSKSTQAEAYARRYRYLSPVTLPRGVVDLPRNVPPRDLPMVATTCSLVAREDLHPALVQLFVQAAARIHSGGGWISKTGQFPTQLNTEFPLARDAERYYRNGPPALQRYLPFWLANLVDRMWVALFSIIAILIPLARVVPPLYQYRIRSRIYRWYRDLRQIEDDARRARTRTAPSCWSELDKLDAKVERVAVPLAYADELYALRSAIGAGAQAPAPG